MPAPEYRNITQTEAFNPKEETHWRDIPDCCHASSADDEAAVAGQQEESLTEILERFIEQDRELEQKVELFQHLKPAGEYTEQFSTELIEKERLNEILEHARREGIPYKLLEYLWELWDCHPEDVGEPPNVREHALSDVIRPMWEQGLEHELKSDLLFDLEGDENMDKLYVPQPQSEIDDPQNLYQLVRKAWEQNRMEELLVMIEENDYALIGETMEEGAARYRKEVEEFSRNLKERMAREREETA